MKRLRQLHILFFCILVAGCGKNYLSLMDSALVKMENREYNSAIKELLKAEQLVPDSAEIYLNLGLSYWQLGEPDKAQQMLNKAMSLTPQDVHAYLYCGIIYLEQGLLNPAMSAFKNASRIKPNSPEIYTWLGVVEMKSKDPVASSLYLKQALSIDPAYKPAIYNLATVYSTFGNNPKEAERYCQEYLRIASAADKQNELKIRGYLQQVINDSSQELNSSVQEKSVKRERSDSLIRQAKHATENANYDSAMVLLEQAVNLDPSNAEALWTQADFYREELGDKKEADKILNQFYSKFPNDSRTPKNFRANASPLENIDWYDDSNKNSNLAFSKGIEYYRRGQLDDAIVCYKKALFFNPDNAIAAYNLGLAYNSKLDYSNAEKAFQSALKLSPDMIEARTMLAVVYRAQKNYLNAEKTLQRLIDQHPNYARAYLYLGYVYQDKGEAKKSIQNFQKFVELEPDSAASKKIRSWLNTL